MRLTDQAVGALMMALQKSLMEQSDIVPVLKEMDFQIDPDDNSHSGLVVLNPPVISLDDTTVNFGDDDEAQLTVPRYLYNCSKCNTDLTVFHLSDETAEKCDNCGADGTLTKKLTRFRTTPTTHKKARTGSITEDFIKDSRVELQKQKEKLEKDR